MSSNANKPQGTAFSDLPDFPEIFINFISNDQKLLNFYNFSKNTNGKIALRIRPSAFGGISADYLKIATALQNSPEKPILIFDDFAFSRTDVSNVFALDSHAKRFDLGNPEYCNKLQTEPKELTRLFGDDWAKFISNNFTLNRFQDFEFEIIKKICSDFDIEFHRTSEIARTDNCKDFIAKFPDIAQNSHELILETAAKLEQAGFKIKPRTARWNFEAAQKQKFIDHNHFKFEEIHKYDSLYPFALLKPVFETWLFGIDGFVCSPSEIGWFAMTKKLFEKCGIEMPQVMPRLSATILSVSLIEHLTKTHRDNKIFELVFPAGHLQERVFNWLNLEHLCRKNHLLTEINKILPVPADKHYSIRI